MNLFQRISPWLLVLLLCLRAISPVVAAPSPQITVDGVRLWEGQSGRKNVAFRVKVWPAPTRPLKVDFATRNGTARAGEDYISTRGTLSIAAKARTATFSVPVLGDGKVERDETFQVRVAAKGYTRQDPAALCLIRNDDRAPKPTATPRPTATPQPTATPRPTATPQPTATPGPLATPEPSPTPTTPPTGVIAFDSFCPALQSNQIYVVNADGTNKTLLTKEGGYSPAYSPDGSQIAFMSGHDANSIGIYTMNSDGMNRKRIAAGSCGSPAWSADGKRIAFVSTVSKPSGANADIYMMDADGSNLAQLTSDPSSEISPSWSRDGSRVIFTARKSGTSLIYSVDVATKQVVAITSDQDMSVETPSYRPDGQKILVQSYGWTSPDHNGFGSAALFLMDADGSHRTQITYGDGIDPTWNPEGTQIAATFYDDPRGIYLLNPDGTGKHIAVSNGENVCHHPSWAPGSVPVLAAPIVTPSTSGKIAFVSERTGIMEIYVMNADGTNTTRLTTSEPQDFNYCPSFSRDGSKIVYDSYRYRDLGSAIYVMNADGTSPKRITPADVNQTWWTETSPVFSPDGRKIAFQFQSDTKAGIGVMNADGSERKFLTTKGYGDAHPSFSGDGNRLVFASNRDGNMDIYAMNIDGTNLTRLTSDRAVDVNPTFSPDGQTILFESNRDGHYKIYSMMSSGGTQARLSDTGASDGYFSPDGSSIAFTYQTDGKTHLGVMNADGTAQTSLTTQLDRYPSWAPGSVPAPPTNASPAKSSSAPAS